MSRNYEHPRVDERWADSRNTHIAVATAIHAIADSIRTADRIWEDPTTYECGRVEMAVAEYIAHGDFPAAPDGQYCWGCEVVRLPPASDVKKYFGDVVRGCTGKARTGGFRKAAPSFWSSDEPHADRRPLQVRAHGK